jgi:hypothetical protein
MKFKISLLVIAALVIALLAWPAVGAPSLTNFTDHVHVLTTGGTATPALRVNQVGAGKIVEFSDGGTPVFSINNGGGIVASSILTQGAVITGLVVSQPTAAATATPAALIDSLSVGSNLLEVRDSATPVFTINNGGVWSSTGAGTHSGGQTVNSWAKVAAPTAIATATPALVVDSAGVSNLVDVRKNATPVFQVAGNGIVTGLVLQYGSSGQRIYCNSSTFTGTLALTSSTTAIATPVVPWCSLNQDPTGVSQTCSTLNASGVVTVSVWSSNPTPEASDEGVSVSYCIIGTP